MQKTACMSIIPHCDMIQKTYTMRTNWDLIWNFAFALPAIVNPVEKIILWVEACKGGTRGFQWRLADLIVLSRALILLTFLFFACQLLNQL